MFPFLCFLFFIFIFLFVYPFFWYYRWIGYDASPFCVAKSLVALEMLRLNKSVSSVLQLCYSSSWRQSTASDFVLALDSLISTLDGYPVEVQTFLLYWRANTHSVPLTTARFLWMEKLGEAANDFLNFKVEVDRNAVIMNIVSGELLDNCVVGNPVMFAHPPKFDVSKGMCFFQSIPDSEMRQLWVRKRSMNQQASASTSSDKKNHSIVDAAVDLFLERLRVVQQKILSGELQADVKLGLISKENTALIAEIQSLKPALMTWSNVPDYIHPKEFHELARQCSSLGKDDTKHILYSMNWHRHVFGSHHVDYCLGPTMSHESKQKMKSVIAQTKAEMSEHLESCGLSADLLDPPLSSAKTFADIGLAKSVHKTWVDMFAKYSMRGNDPHSMVNIESVRAEFSSTFPMRRVSTVVFLKLSY
jgi:hypothetical protein